MQTLCRLSGHTWQHPLQLLPCPTRSSQHAQLYCAACGCCQAHHQTRCLSHCYLAHQRHPQSQSLPRGGRQHLLCASCCCLSAAAAAAAGLCWRLLVPHQGLGHWHHAGEQGDGGSWWAAAAQPSANQQSGLEAAESRHRAHEHQGCKQTYPWLQRSERETKRRRMVVFQVLKCDRSTFCVRCTERSRRRQRHIIALIKLLSVPGGRDRLFGRQSALHSLADSLAAVFPTAC